MSDLKEWQGLPGAVGHYGIPPSVGVRGLFRAEPQAPNGGIPGQIADINAKLADHEQRIVALEAARQDHEQRLAKIEAYQQRGFHAELASPAPTNSTAYVMMGIGLTFTTQYSTRAIFIVDGQIGNSANNGATDAQLVWGTGPVPANGDVFTGTLLGTPVRFVSVAGGNYTPFSQAALLEGIVIGTQCWVDLAAKVDRGNTVLSELEITGFPLVEGL